MGHEEASIVGGAGGSLGHWGAGWQSTEPRGSEDSEPHLAVLASRPPQAYAEPMRRCRRLPSVAQLLESIWIKLADLLWVEADHVRDNRSRVADRYASHKHA